MSGHHSATDSVEHEPHAPAPSISPPVIGLGVMILSFGILWSVILIVVGVAILLVGLLTWLIDDARAYASAPEPTDGAHH